MPRHIRAGDLPGWEDALEAVRDDDYQHWVRARANSRRPDDYGNEWRDSYSPETYELAAATVLPFVPEPEHLAFVAEKLLGMYHYMFIHRARRRRERRQGLRVIEGGRHA